MTYTPQLTVIFLRMIASCTLVTIWLIQFFLHPLHNDSIIMHEQQLDPTEIIAIPYPWQRLTVYVMANVVATVGIQTSVRSMLQTFLDIIQLSCIFMILFVICGASPYQNIYHTYISSLYFVTCTFFQYPSIFVHTDTTTIADTDGVHYDDPDDIDVSEKYPSTKTVLHRIPQPRATVYPIRRIPQLLEMINLQLRGQSVGIIGQTSSSPSPPQHQQQAMMILLLHQSIVYCCTIVTILFQILLLYDRGYQIQRYPIPIILGCTIGWIVGTCIGTIRAIRQDQSSRKV